MPEILGNARTINQLLKGVKYSVDYYQREYRWEEKQIAELIADLTDKFLGDFDPGHTRGEVANYGHYFLGAIIISRKDNINYIVDGQQRITSLTLLLIYLRNLQKAYANKVNVDELIFSEKFGKKSFNLDVEDRSVCMEALFSEQLFDATDRSESIQNIVARYSDIEGLFPGDLAHEIVLPYFIDWLIENVHLVEITAYSDDDAYTIFETMNDRGLSLSMTEMLKGFLLSSISDSAKRNHANDFWKKRIEELNDLGKDTDSDCFKAWLRSQYSMKIRERKKNAAKEDFDKIGSEYHRWIRENEITLGLTNSDNFYNFIDRNFNFYSRQYMRLLQVSRKMTPGFELVLYNWNHGFTLQYMLLLSPLKPDDPEDIINLKLLLVSRFIDILLAWRIWNYRSIAYSTMQYAMFLVMREIRGLDVKALAQKMLDILAKEDETFASNDKLRMHQQNKWYLHRILARSLSE